MSDDDVYGRERYRAIKLPNEAKAAVWFRRLGDRIEMHTEVKSPEGGGSGTSNWNGCSQTGCVGEVLPGTATCYSHSAPNIRQAYLSRIPDLAKTAIFTLRGNKITAALWSEIAPRLFEGNTLRAPVSLAGSEVTTPIRLNGILFEYYFDLSGANVFEHIELRQCEFRAGLTASSALSS